MLSTWFKNKNMKSSGQKEKPEDKKKYVFFSDPDVVAKRAETSAIVSDFCYFFLSYDMLNSINNSFISDSTNYIRFGNTTTNY